MGRGDALSGVDLTLLDETIRRAEQASRVEFSVFVGRTHGDPRAFAAALHGRLVAPSRSVLIMVDPTARVVEVVSGSDVRRSLTDHEAQLAVAAMQSHFAAGELVAGLRAGVESLAEHARSQPSLHTSRS